MATLDQLVQELERIIAALVELCTAIEAIERSWTEVDVELIVLLRESNAPEAHDTLASAGKVEPGLVAARTRVSAAIGLVQTYRARLTGLSPPQTPDRPAPPPAAVHRDGSRYPPQAQWALDDLPNRVRSGTGDRTVGRILLDGRDVGSLTSGLDDVWSPAVVQRMRDLGIRSFLRLDAHVEMKVAELMRMHGASTAILVLNHATCGSQRPIRSGCHQALPRYLEPGSTLVVHGTTAEGQPFSHRYEGDTR